MAKLKFRTISKRTVDALVVEDRDEVFWDDRIPGFGVRVYPSGSKMYVVQTRHKGKSRRVTLGRHGVITAGSGAQEGGRDPQPHEERRGPGGAGLGDGGRARRALSGGACRHALQGEHAEGVPQGGRAFHRAVLRRMAVEDVEREHIDKLHRDLHHIPYQANRALEIGTSLFNFAEEWKLRSGGNPCRYVRKYQETKRERFLTEAEFRHLGAVLNEMEAEGRLPVYPAAAIRC